MAKKYRYKWHQSTWYTWRSETQTTHRQVRQLAAFKFRWQCNRASNGELLAEGICTSREEAQAEADKVGVTLLMP